MANHDMTGYAPGVYMFEENTAGPIQGVSTSIAAFVGPASKGPYNKPTVITSFAQYESLFGGYEVNQGKNSTFYVPYAVKGFFENGGAVCKFVRVKDNGITEGQDVSNKPTTEDYKKTIDILEKEEDVNILCVPDSRGDSFLQKYIINHCEQMKNRFAILDVENNVNNKGYNNALDYMKDKLSSDGGYAAVYYPWLTIPDPLDNKKTLDVPPSGHIAGVYARVDAQRGVFKAPANEPIKGILGVTDILNATEQGSCNEKSLNIIKPVSGKGILIWGARTISSSNQWRYINIRRLLVYIEESIKKATMFAIFEPNNLLLWGNLKRQINGFLVGVWRSGALVGATADKSFEILIDSTNNPPEMIQQGYLNIQVKLYPTTPTEFIVFSIIQTPGGVNVQE